MKKPIAARAPRSRNVTLQLSTILKRMDEVLAENRQHRDEIKALKSEIEDLRREVCITMESIAELPFVSGVIH